MNTLQANPSPSTATGIGELIREARQQRRLSQMDLALDVGISPRHLSFVETGRSRPGAEVLLAIAQRLALPLRTRNVWLLAAGYAPRYSEQPLASSQMAQIHAALDKLLAAVGGWARIGTRLRRPYRWIGEERVPPLYAVARRELPELFSQ